MNEFWQDKHVVAYIALKHHTRFIVPIMEQLASWGARTEYLVAQAERSQEITAIETSLDYHHIFDFLKEEDHDDIKDIYLLLRDTFGRTLVKDIAFSLQVPTVLDKTLSSTAQEYVAFKNYFTNNRPDLCIALHEVNRWGKLFAFHAKRNGIPFITLQEGLLTAASANLSFQMTGHVQYSSLCFVWGKNSKDKLINYEAPEDRILPVGNTHLSNEIVTLKKNNIRKKKRAEYNVEKKHVVLLLFSSDIPKSKELVPIYNALIKKRDIHLITKFHPATTRLSITKWMNDFPENLKEMIHPVHGEENTYNLIAMSDLCVLSEGSTTGLEALAIGKPLVLLDLESPVIYQSNLVEENAAIGMTPVELAKALIKNQNFNQFMNKAGVEQYIRNELYKPHKSIDYTTALMEKAVSAFHHQTPEKLNPYVTGNTTDWSIILPITEPADIFLMVLEQISLNSSDHNYEVILLRPEKISNEINTILESLDGDVNFLTHCSPDNCIPVLNQAAQTAGGEYVVFMNEGLSPLPGWLDNLKYTIDRSDPKAVFGAHITNHYKNIIHAGIVLNANNQPASAYQYLDEDFPHSKKTRAFQMVDHFLCSSREKFLSMGGFELLAGQYKFMDFCLRTNEITGNSSAIFCGDVRLVKLQSETASQNIDASIYFYSRWHGQLWESESRLLETDGVSTLQLDAARMTRALETSGLT